MIYEYAVDPTIFVSEEKAIFILESFGRDKGRLVSEIRNGHWLKLVRDAIRTSDNKTIAKHTLKEALKKLVKNQKALYVRQQQVKDDSTWLRLTEKAHKVWPYRGILVEEYDGTDEFFLVRDIYLSDKPNWFVPNSITVDRETKAMVEAVSSLLFNAREVMLVDRNFRMENQHGSHVRKYQNVLIRFLNFLANKQYGPPVRKLTYHLGDKYYSSKTLKNKCECYLKKHIPAGMRLEFAIWPWGELHDRFVLTDIGGVDFGMGLDEFAGTNEKNVRIKRLSNVDHASEWSKFKQKLSDVEM
jgi:hypothetical protein